MGKAFVFGDNVDTDSIVPGQYLNVSNPQELAKVCMEGYKPGFISNVAAGDIFIAGKNFGCGSSREHAPVSIKAAGIACVIAQSFARIFYRNAINIGLPVLESPEAVKDIEPGNEIIVDFENGKINNLAKAKAYDFSPFPPAIMAIITCGGLVPYVQTRNEFKNKV